MFVQQDRTRFDKKIHEDEFRLRLLVTNTCDLNCSYCLNDFQGKTPVRYIDANRAMEYITEYGSFMKSIGEQSIVTFSGGEPGLHSDLTLMLQCAKLHCDVVKVVTNGKALIPSRSKYVDCWHIGTSDKKYYALYYAKEYAKNVVFQLVVTDALSVDEIVSWIQYYNEHQLTVKLFTDFFSPNQKELRDKIECAIETSNIQVLTRFTGLQENRGNACAGCDQKCITLKALWVFPDGSASTCPQGIVPSTNNDNIGETIRLAYDAHRV